MSNVRAPISISFDVFEVPAMVHAVSVARTTAHMCSHPRVRKMHEQYLEMLEQIFPRDLVYLFSEETWVKIGHHAQTCASWAVRREFKYTYSDDDPDLVLEFSDPLGNQVKFKTRNTKKYDDPIFERLRTFMEPHVHIDAVYNSTETDAERYARQRRERRAEREKENG